MPPEIPTPFLQSQQAQFPGVSPILLLSGTSAGKLNTTDGLGHNKAHHGRPGPPTAYEVEHKDIALGGASSAGGGCYSQTPGRSVTPAQLKDRRIPTTVACAVDGGPGLTAGIQEAMWSGWEAIQLFLRPPTGAGPQWKGDVPEEGAPGGCPAVTACTQHPSIVVCHLV
jgi:hypothetical protein